MMHVQDNGPISVVEIDSSDDEGGAPIEKRSKELFQSQQSEAASTPAVAPPDSNSKPLDSRSFWKAGAYEIGPIKVNIANQGELEHARVHPKFLHSNATSHKWAFGAIAELLDNAVDEICNGATFVKVDRIYNTKDNSPALLFQDDGGGMDPEGMRKCMSLGYSSKTSNTTIGQYGNGFKTSTMRLGADVIVFSRSSRSGRATQSVGLLSYTFLRRTGQDDVIVPMIDFDISDHWAEPMIYSSQDDWSVNLKTILEWSPFESKEVLMQQFEDIGAHGTKVLIYNLWLNDEGIYELNFDDDDEDIKLRDEANQGIAPKTKRAVELQSHISYRLRYSLRAYASILYLRKFTNFKIILRGKPVEQYNIAEDLTYSTVIKYRPNYVGTAKEVTVETTIGFIKEVTSRLSVTGFNVYHKNRLIRPYWKVTADGSSKGYGVVGVLEANFIEPAHDKQDFERSSLFSKLEARLKQMINEYWRSHCHLIGYAPIGVSRQNEQGKSIGQPQAAVQTKSVLQPQVKAANIRQQSSRREQTHLGQSIIDLDADSQDNFIRMPVSSHIGTTCTRESSVLPTVTSTTEPLHGVSVNGSGAAAIDQLCEENIQLFMRCEAYLQKENELKHTIEELEKQLEETRKKSASVASHIEGLRRQKLTKREI